VDAVAISEEIGAAKPDPRAFAAVAGMLELAPAALVMVGDNWALDIEGSRGAGFAAAYYVGVEDRPDRLDSVALLPGVLGLDQVS
jgi:putative hydrolase of the HAD superfamily